MFTRKQALSVFFALLMAAAFTGCGGGDGGGNGSTTLSLNDLDGASDVPVDKAFSYAFGGQPVNSSTVTAATFFIVKNEWVTSVLRAAYSASDCDVAEALPASVNCTSMTECVLDPAEDLEPLMSYTACLTPDIDYMSGASFAGFMATFMTAPKLRNVRVIPGSTSTDLIASWDALSGATSYNIYWGTAPGVTKTTGTKIEGATSPYTQDGLTTGTPYYYIVAAVFPLGEGPVSSEVVAYPQIDPVGTLDSTFNGTGYVQFTAVKTFEAGGVEIDSEGRIVVAGSTLDAVTGYDMALWRYNADGTPDTTFGGGDGYVTVHGTAGGNNWDKGFDLAIDSNGRLLVAGESENAGLKDDMVIWRFNGDGTADTTFGTGGAVLYNRGLGGNCSARSLAVDPDGNIVATGYCAGPVNDDMTLWRYTPDGTLDTTFGTNGVVFYNPASDKPSEGNNVAIDSNGKIVIVGIAQDATDTQRLTLWRYYSNGTLDTTFGGTGVVMYTGGDASQGFGVAVDPDDRIVATGDYSSGAISDAVVTRFTNGGTLDTTFSDDGAAFYSTADTDGAAAVAVDARGRVLITGISSLGMTTSAMFLARFTAAGELDTTFGTGGAVTYHDISIANSEDNGRAIAFDLTGRIIVAGTTSPYGDQRLIIWRYK